MTRIVVAGLDEPSNCAKLLLILAEGKLVAVDVFEATDAEEIFVLGVQDIEMTDACCPLFT